MARRFRLALLIEGELGEGGELRWQSDLSVRAILPGEEPVGLERAESRLLRAGLHTLKSALLRSGEITRTAFPDGAEFAMEER